MQTDTQEEVQSTTTSVPPMPNWLMVIFKIYALLILVSVITAAIKLSVSIVSQLVEFSRVIWLTPLSSTGFLVAVFYTTVAVVIALVAAYSLGLFGLKRWCLPILFFTVISLSLVTLLNLLLNNFADSVEFVGRILTLVVTIGIGYSAWRYRAAFLGPTRRLSLQIPLILVLLPIALISILGQIYTDDEAIVDNDLLLPTVAILSEADNAQLALPTIDSLTLSDRAVFDQVHEYHRMLSIGKDIDISAANAAIGSLTEIIDQFLEASRKPGYQCPASVNVHRSDAVLCNLSGIRSVARVVALR